MDIDTRNKLYFVAKAFPLPLPPPMKIENSVKHSLEAVKCLRRVIWIVNDKEVAVDGNGLPRSAADCTRQYWVPNVIRYLRYSPENNENAVASHLSTSSVHLFKRPLTLIFFPLYFSISTWWSHIGNEFTSVIYYRWMAAVKNLEQSCSFTKQPSILFLVTAKELTLDCVYIK